VRFGEIIGRVTLSKYDPMMQAGRFMIVRPNDAASLRERREGSGEIVVAYDNLGSCPGQQVSFSEGREAACPFHPDRVAVDAFIGALLDDITYEA